MVKFIFKFLFPLIVVFVAFQAYQTYSGKAEMEKALISVVNDFRAGNIWTNEEIQKKVEGVLEDRGAYLTASSLVLHRNDDKPDLTFSLDYTKSPNLFVIDIPLAFHAEIPPPDADPNLLGKIIKGTRTKINGAQADSAKKTDDLEAAANSK